jgi:hypothetical protein
MSIVVPGRFGQGKSATESAGAEVGRKGGLREGFEVDFVEDALSARSP